MPTAILAAFRLARPFLPWIGGALALIALVVLIDHRGFQRGFHKRDAEVAALTLTIANVRTATAKAQADDLAHATAVKARDDAIRTEKTDELEARLAAARRDAANYAGRLRLAAKADPGGRVVAGLPAAPGPAGDPHQAGGVALLDADLRACSEAAVIAAGWQDWWTDVAKVER